MSLECMRWQASATTSGGASSVLSFSSRMADPWVICSTIASFDADLVGILLEDERELFRWDEKRGPLQWSFPLDHSSWSLLVLIAWPSQSSDLNPIENLWGHLDLQLKNSRCCNEDQLFQTIQNGWKLLDKANLASLVESMPKRIEAVLAARLSTNREKKKKIEENVFLT